ncbi:MAG TPA: head decoration protein [Oligoflexus sp.]|uniref:head decoration protein n=1 Tax=Oligoflexus sp. TaxID=1971216 RepID=UPI002D80900C|nr:head decoration protein [Oligoflexus sp.]HET9235909.1 head decoration protein [Oligoflexus sp.]
MKYQPGYTKVAKFEPKGIRLGHEQIRRDSVVIEKGQKLVMGSILGRKPNGKFVLCAAKNEDGTPVTDGSEKAYCILQVDVDATDSDREGEIYRQCAAFWLDLTVGRGHTMASVVEDLAARGIFINKGEK